MGGYSVDILSLISESTTLPRPKPGQSPSPFVSNSRYLFESAVSATGLVAAVLVNILFPQVIEIEAEVYWTGGLGLMASLTYCIVLSGIVLLYAGLSVFSFLSPVRKEKFLNRVTFRFASGLVLALWDIFDTKLQWLPMSFFPGSSRITEAFLLEGGFIFQNTLYSLRLFIVGSTPGVASGIGAGILIDWLPKIYYWAFPVLEIARVIPAVIQMPFALTLSPTPFLAAAFLIVTCAWLSAVFLTVQGVASTPGTLFGIMHTLGAKISYLVFRAAIPHAMPQIFTGVPTVNGFALTTLVISEVMGQPGGLRYYVNTSKVRSVYYKVFVAILVMVVLSPAIMKVIGAIQGRVLRQQKGMVR